MSCAGELVPIGSVADGTGLNLICIGAAFDFAGIAGYVGGLRLLLGCCPRLHGFCGSCHGQRRAVHGRASDRSEQVVKGSFHSGAFR